MAESFDAVLAEMRQLTQRRREEDGDITAYEVEDFADRIAAAHAAEVGERDEEIRVLHILNAAQAVAITDNADDATLAESRADRAVGLLREWVLYGGAHHPTLLRDTEAFLSEQAGERENGDG